MSIKIAFRTAPDPYNDGTRYIAEGVTAEGVQLSYTTSVSGFAADAHGPILAAHAKRQALYNLIDDAIHRELL